MPDLALADAIQQAEPAIDIHWVSYGTGAETLRGAGRHVIDLKLPDNNSFLGTQVRVIGVLEKLRPDVVVSHEEFSAAPAARGFNIPNIFLVDYFARPRHLWMQCLRFADRIIFIDQKGYFDEPPFLKDKVQYVGSFVRPMEFTAADRPRTRLDLGFSPDALVVLVLPGGWFTEARAPIFDLVLAAYRLLQVPKKRLVWFAGDEDYEWLSKSVRDSEDVIVKRPDPHIDKWMAASDVAITKGTRKSSLELEYAGIPSISLSYGLNKIDDRRVSRIQSNIPLRADATDPQTLASHILRSLVLSAYRKEGWRNSAPGFSTAVRNLVEFIRDRRPDENSKPGERFDMAFQG